LVFGDVPDARNPWLEELGSYSNLFLFLEPVPP
jgi:hypothetical protein